MHVQPHLEAIERFRAKEALALSLYLDLSTPVARAKAAQRAFALVCEALCHAGLDCNDGLSRVAEDLELVRLYLKTSAAGRSSFVAFFSCAQELFWRALPLPGPLAESASVGESFDLGPLRLSLVLQPQGELAG